MGNTINDFDCCNQPLNEIQFLFRVDGWKWEGKECSSSRQRPGLHKKLR
jgi:hypothetical protein